MYRKLQEWNRPRPRKVDVIPVLELGSRKDAILKKQAHCPVPSQYDPRPCSMQSCDSSLIEKLRIDLVKYNPSCALLHLLSPHDHNYTDNKPKPNSLSVVNNSINTTKSCQTVHVVDECSTSNSFHDEKVKLSVTIEERSKIEEETRSQLNSSQWFAV